MIIYKQVASLAVKAEIVLILRVTNLDMNSYLSSKLLKNTLYIIQYDRRTMR